MTPDEARKDCWCESYRKPCEYHEGYQDGYEAAQRERSANGLYYGADANMPRTTTQVQHFASETNYGRPGR